MLQVYMIKPALSETPRRLGVMDYSSFGYFRMSRPRHRRRTLTAMRSIRPKNYRKSDCFVACSSRVLLLIGPPYPLSVGTTHATIGLFRALYWVARALPRARERMRVGVGIL